MTRLPSDLSIIVMAVILGSMKKLGTGQKLVQKRGLVRCQKE